MKLSQVLNIAQALSTVQSDRLSGKPIYAIARNINEIEPVTKAYQKRRDDLIRQVSGGGTTIAKEDTQKIAEFTSLIEKELESEIDIKFHSFEVKEEELPGAFGVIALSLLLELGIVRVAESQPVTA